MKSWESDATVRSYDIALDCVEHADYIGDLSTGQKVYCTSKKANDYVTVKLKTVPENVSLPEGVVKWGGGEPGENQLVRKVSKKELIEDGLPLTAKIEGNENDLKFRVYVYRAKPKDGQVDINISVVRDDLLLQKDNQENNDDVLGRTYFGGRRNPVCEFEIYYKDGIQNEDISPEWGFVFNSISYKIYWGIDACGRANVASAGITPFPFGKDMETNVREKERCYIAASVFFPNEFGQVRTKKYWNERLVMLHEIFHANDWIRFFLSNI